MRGLKGSFNLSPLPQDPILQHPSPGSLCLDTFRNRTHRTFLHSLLLAEQLVLPENDASREKEALMILPAEPPPSPSMPSCSVMCDARALLGIRPPQVHPGFKWPCDLR